MNTLRLEIINLHAPYTVKQREDKPQHYYFRTDYGVEYDISLEEEFSLVPSGAYALDIYMISANGSAKIGKYYYVPDGVVTICDGAFMGIDDYLELSVPRCIKVIGDYIFGQKGGKIVIRD